MFVIDLIECHSGGHLVLNHNALLQSLPDVKIISNKSVIEQEEVQPDVTSDQMALAPEEIHVIIVTRTSICC